MKNTSQFSVVVLQPLLLCIRDGKFWGKGKGEGATSAVTQSSAPHRDVFPLENAAGEQWFSLAPTAPPALHFQALSPGTWQAAHRNIRWQHFQHERRELTPLDKTEKQREAGAGNREGQHVEARGKTVRSAKEGGGGQHGGTAPTACFQYSHCLSPVTTLGMRVPL